MAISMLKIRRPLGRLIFNMGIAIPGKTVFLIETAPLSHSFCLRSAAAITTDYNVYYDRDASIWKVIFKSFDVNYSG